MASLRDSLRQLHPAYFAMVMATGIIAIGADLMQMSGVAVVLCWLNVVLFLGLWGATLARVVWHRGAVLSDLTDHNRAPGFFTTIAAAGILGSQWLVVYQATVMALSLWIFAILLWIALTYTIFAGLTIKEAKPTLAEGINGGWLIAVVATQSLSVLGARLAPEFSSRSEAVLFFALSMWLWGGMLYIWMISLIFYRYVFFKMSPADLTPPYWINMGAVAISTLAGATLVIDAPRSRLLSGTLPFLQGLTLLFWATGTWWIPMLIILGLWRHVWRKFKLSYDPLYWGVVFPLGMYAVCTFQLARATGFDFLFLIPPYFMYAAMAAWLLAFIGFVRAIGAVLFASESCVSNEPSS